jgi:hypothetical protein
MFLKFRTVSLTQTILSETPQMSVTLSIDNTARTPCKISEVIMPSRKCGQDVLSKSDQPTIIMTGNRATLMVINH